MIPGRKELARGAAPMDEEKRWNGGQGLAISFHFLGWQRKGGTLKRAARNQTKFGAC
jgi:hypothetical protein